MSAVDIESRVSDARDWLHEFLGCGECDGRVCLAMSNDKDPDPWSELRPFRFDTPPFLGLVPDHGAMLDAMGPSVVMAADQGNDVYASPYLHEGRRRKGGAVDRRHVHADIDGPLDLALVRELGGFAVASGSLTADGSPHGHAFLRLSTSVDDAEEHQRLCRALGRRVGGEHHDTSKVSDNDVLRPAGTLNHKTDPPRPVTWLIRPDDPGVRTWDPDVLAAELAVPPTGVQVDDGDDDGIGPLDLDDQPSSTGQVLTAEQARPRLEGALRRLSQATEGDRNNQLNKQAGLMAGLLARVPEADRDIGTWQARLVVTARQIGLTEAEVRATLDSAWRYGTQHPPKDPAPVGISPSSTHAERGVVGGAATAAVVPSLPPDIERCPAHPAKLDSSCLRCLVVREQVVRYGRNRAVAREGLAMVSPDAWEPVDLSTAEDLPQRSLLWAEPAEPGGDRVPFLRPGQVSGVHGMSGSGKTHLAYIGGVQEVRAGNLWVIVDYEMRREQSRAALLELGLTDAEIKDGIVYFEDPPAIDDFYFERLMDRVQRRIDITGRPLTYALYDSISRSMGKVPGWTTNDELHVNAWYDSLPRRLLREYPRHTPFTIDHPGRTDGPDSIGSHAKGAGPDFKMWCQKGDKFTRHNGGSGRSPIQIPKARSSARDVVHFPLDVDLAELIVVAGALRFRMLPPPDKDDVDVPLDKMGKRDEAGVLVLNLLRQAAAAGLMTGEVTGHGSGHDARRAALTTLETKGLVRRRPAGKGERWWLTEFAP